ncbi:MAG: GNAT family N-acetyltransferase [Pseudomonadota bacterium]
MPIRSATLDDIPTMIAIGREMHEESVFSPYSFDIPTLTLLMSRLIKGDHGIALVEEVDGVVVGGFLGVVWPHFFGPDLQASDLALFIRPEYRGGSAGFRLIRAFITEAKARGAAQVVLANSTGIQPERVAGLFERVGLRQVGYVYSLNLKGE